MSRHRSRSRLRVTGSARRAARLTAFFLVPVSIVFGTSESRAARSEGAGGALLDAVR